MPEIDPAERRSAIESLAEAIRGLADAAAETAVAPEVVRDVTTVIRGLQDRLCAETDDTPYSGLALQPVDRSVPEGPMPLNPIIGACSPNRPEVTLRFVDGAVRGTARMSKRFTGPPGFVHGGILAMLADQIVAVAPGAIGERCITKRLHVRFRRPVPVGAEVDLRGACALGDDEMTARFTITVDGEVAVEGAGEVVRYQRMAERTS